MGDIHTETEIDRQTETDRYRYTDNQAPQHRQPDNLTKSPMQHTRTREMAD